MTMPDRRVTTLAKTMRRRMTKYEYRLYANFLSQIPVKVCRQKVIGDYIVDFLIPPLSQPFFFVARKKNKERSAGSAIPLRDARKTGAGGRNITTRYHGVYATFNIVLYLPPAARFRFPLRKTGDRGRRQPAL